MAFMVYILQNQAGRFYIGHTEDLSKRLESHQRIDVIAGKYTRKNGPWQLVWSEPHPDRATAMLREREIKAWKSAKHTRQRLLGLPE